MRNANATRAVRRADATATPAGNTAWGCDRQVMPADLALALTYLYLASWQALGRWLRRIGEVGHG